MYLYMREYVTYICMSIQNIPYISTYVPTKLQTEIFPYTYGCFQK